MGRGRGQGDLAEERLGRRSAKRELTAGMEKKVQREEGTEGRNLQGKEVALRYRLQMAAFIRTKTGEVAGGQAVECLRDMAATAGVMLFLKESKGKRWVARCAPHTWMTAGYVYILDGDARS